MKWLALLLLAIIGYAAEYYSEVWGVRYNNLVNAPTRSLPKETMVRRIGKAWRFGLLLLILGSVDVGSVIGGWQAFTAVMVGAMLGGRKGVMDVLWAKWESKNDDD